MRLGVSKFERAIINSFEAIASNSQASGDTIQAAFERALESIKSPEGIEQLERNLDRLRQEGRLTESQLEQLQNQLNQLGQQSRETARETTPLSDSLNDIGDAADQLGGDGGSLGSISSLLELMKNPAVALAGAFAALVASYVAINKESDEVKSHLLTLLGTQEKVTEAMEYAARVSQMLGTNLNETAESWVDFDNGMKALGVSADDSRRLFEQLSYSIIKTGGDINDVREDAVEMFNEALTEGTINGEALQELLRGRLAPAFDAMARAAGFSRDELGSMLDKGIAVNDLLPLLTQGLKDAFGETQYIESFNGGLERIQNSLTILLSTDAGNSALVQSFDVIAQSVVQLSQFIDTAQANLTNMFEVFEAFRPV